MESTERQSIAILGSGIGGLSAAWLLSKKFDVTIIEKAHTFGMDQASIDLPSGRRIDAPPRAFSREFYPVMNAIYDEAGVEKESWSWESSAACLGSRAYMIQGRTYMFGIPGPIPCMSLGSWMTFLTQFGLSSCWDAYKFGRNGERDILDPELHDMPLKEYIQLRKYGDGFVKGFLLPMFSMVCGCSYDHLYAYPAGIILQFWGSTGYANQFHAKLGSGDIGRKLTSRVKECLFSTPVLAVHPGDPNTGRKARVEMETATGRQTREFDAVVMATDAAAAAKLLQDDSHATLLEKFEYVRARVAIHRSPKMMPLHRTDWSPMNVVCRPDLSKAMFTMWLSNPRVLGPFCEQDAADGDIFQTWNPFLDEFAPEELNNPAILLANFDTVRSLVTPSTKRYCEELKKLQGKGGIFYVGAYVNYEVPLQENAAKSAAQVAGVFGISPGELEKRKHQLHSHEQRGNYLRPFATAIALLACTRMLLKHNAT